MLDMDTKYIFLDVDGTLFSNQLNAVPPSALLAIQQARTLGHKIFLCTGRGLAQCSAYLNYSVDGFIFAAGAMVYVKDQLIYDNFLSKEEEFHIKELCKKHHLGYAIEGQAGAYCESQGFHIAMVYFSKDNVTEEEKKQNAIKNGFYPECYEAQEERACKFSVYTKHGGSFLSFQEELPTNFVLTPTFYGTDNSDGADVTKQGISKATGIQKILEYYGAEPKDSIGIGDSKNDLSMIGYCGYSIAMGNGDESIKEKADWVTSDILEDGIYNAFKHVGVI